ncbi:MAG TPA: hypothetical protein EYQ82_04525 [Dehalococcoidia bacterium]|jgi:hypothetical protein|nr:hypothetical protein [Dehalococcoidia bacterium]
MNWVVFATAPDQLTAEMWQDLLSQANIRCQLRAGDTYGFLGVSASPVRLVTPQEDAEVARDALETLINLSEISIAKPGATDHFN